MYYSNSERPTGTCVAVAVAHPKSRGNITLASNDPLDRPIIHANLLQHPDDRDVMKQGTLHAITLSVWEYFTWLNFPYARLTPNVGDTGAQIVAV